MSDPPDYAAASRVGRPLVLSITSVLIALNVAVFALDPLLMHFGFFDIQHRPDFTVAVPILHSWGSFTLYDFVRRLQFYRLITFQFLHANLTHLFMNMIALYIFGPLVEDFLGRWRFVCFYLLCGIGGPLLYTILYGFNRLGGSPMTPLVGASAGIFGVLIAAAIIAPHEEVLIYGIVPVRLRTMAWLLLAVAAFTVIIYGQSARYNAGGQAAHLGGAAVGWMLMLWVKSASRKIS